MRNKALIAFAATLALAAPVAGCGGDDSDDGGGGGGDSAFLKSYDEAFGPLTAKQPALQEAIQKSATGDGKAIAAAFEPVKPAVEQTSAALAKLKAPKGAEDEFREVQGTVGAVGENIDAAIAAGESGKTPAARAAAKKVESAVQPFIEANAAMRQAAE